MTPSNPSTSKDDPKISQHYHIGATEGPSSLIDQKILEQAKATLLETDEAVNPAYHIRPKAWRKWQWSGSIAASVLLVSLLFMFNQTYYSEIDLATDQQYMETLAASKRQVEQAIKMEQRAAQSQTSRVKAPGKKALDVTHFSDEKHIQNDASTQFSTANQIASLAEQEKDLADNIENSEQQRKILSRPRELAVLAESSADVDDFTDEQLLSPPAPAVVQVTGSRLTSKTDKSPIDYQYLDSLLEELLPFRQGLAKEQSHLTTKENLAAEQQNELIEGKNTDDWKQIQAELFSILLAHKQSDPKLLLSEKYLEVLSDEQLIKLLAVSKHQANQIED
jgi:hypothetical protein